MNMKRWWRSEAKPSDLHLGLLMLGLKPGQPIHFDQATKTWLPPTGPAVQIWLSMTRTRGIITRPRLSMESAT